MCEEDDISVGDVSIEEDVSAEDFCTAEDFSTAEDFTSAEDESGDGVLEIPLRTNKS